MGRLTPEDILKLSEPVELVYQQVTDALLINIARHFNTGKALSTQEWQMKKLAELGQLNKESLQIIASMTGQTSELIQLSLESAALQATRDIEPELQEAVKKGVLQGASADTVLASESIRQSLAAYAGQAVDKTNLVNTVMLESTLNQYRKVIANTVRLEQRLKAVQGILNTAAGKAVTGAFSRTQALRDALKQISAEGLTGFIDKAGRQWSPEAYVNMDIRTTVHNTAIEAVKQRQEDYGTDIFLVSRHSGARPLCYPYQGRYFSWSNKSGTFTDGEGKRHRYSPISSTSYGKPAGLFGINCNHDPIPIIPGVSIPRERTPQNKEENDRTYQLSQRQRKLEREVRYAKRDATMLEAAGDTEGFEKAAQKVKQKQAAYNSFCKETGRTKRLDRTQVLEYNKNVSAHARSALSRYDIVIGRSVGAKAANYDILEPSTGEIFQFVEGTHIRDAYAFAGKGTKRPLHEGVAEGLSEQLGGKPENWRHMKGYGTVDYYGEERPAEVHWFEEESVGRVKFKIKRWEDEG